MKKSLIVVITVLSLFISSAVQAKINVPEKSDHEKVNVYLFWSSNCTNCHNLIKYFKDDYQNYQDYFQIVSYQINNNDNNSALADLIAEKVGEEVGFVPLLVIGDSYHILGWDDKIGDTVIKEALKAYEDKNYTDIVAATIQEKKLDVENKTYQETCKVIGINCSDNSKEKLNTKFVICFVSSVILLGSGGLIALSKKEIKKA